MVIVNVQGFFVWVNEGQGLVVWEKGSLWPVMLIFYSSCQGLKQKNSLDLMSRNGSNSVLEESLERLKKQGPNVNRRKTNMNGPRRGKTQGIQFQSANHACRGCLISGRFDRLDL